MRWFDASPRRATPKGHTFITCTAPHQEVLPTHRTPLRARGAHKIEHRLFSFITINWRGKPLESRQVIIDLIASTTTSTGLKVYARLDEGTYPDKIKVPDVELAAVRLQGDPFHPEWNYTITPRHQDN